MPGCQASLFHLNTEKALQGRLVLFFKLKFLIYIKWNGLCVCVCVCIYTYLLILRCTHRYIYNYIHCCFSVTKLHPTFQPHGLQHARIPCPSLSPGVCLSLCPLSWWCYLTISSSVTPFVFCLQSFPASGSFPMSWLFKSGGQSIRASASASVLPVIIQGWLPLGVTGLISLLSKGVSTVFSSTTVQKHQFFGTQPSLWSSSHIHTWLLEKPQLWLYYTLIGKVMSLFLIHSLGLS